MEPLTQLLFPKALQNALRHSQQAPKNSRFRLAYAQCDYWQHADFSILEQYYHTEHIFLYLAEVDTRIELELPFKNPSANVFWLYQLEEDTFLTIHHEQQKARLKTKERTYRVVYLPPGEQSALFSAGRHYLLFYFVISQELLQRFQHTSLKYLKAILDKLGKAHPEFGFSIQLPIDGQVLRYLNTLFHLRRLDRLELEAEIPPLILKLIALGRQQYYQKSAAFKIEASKLEEIRLYAQENILKGQLFTIQELAEQFYISAYQLRITHKQAYGESLQSYITRTKMLEARRLIAEEGLRPTEAAYAMGYYDSTAMAKGFLKHFGLTPSEVYRHHRRKTP